MIKFKVLLGSVAALALVTSAQAAELNIYNWGDYTNPKLLEKFTAETGIAVTIDDYGSNEEMLAKIQAGNPGYDIVVPSDYMVKVMIDEGLLAETRPDQMPNFKNVDPRWVNVDFDPGRRFSVPWQWGTTAFAIDTDVYKGDINTWALMLEPPPELQGKINVQPDMNEVIHAAAWYLGKPVCNDNPEDLKEIYELLQQAKPHWRTIDYGMIDAMVAGDVALSHGWNGAAIRTRLAKPSVAWARPKEGYHVWMDNVVVLADAADKDAAAAFQNFIMAPENAALISDYAKYANGILGTEKFYADPEFAASPELHIGEDEVQPVWVPLCPPQVIEKYNQIWTNLLK